MTVRIKICGITSEADAHEAAHLGADAIGLNFFQSSPRFIGEERAAAIVRSLPPFVEPVALFVNEPYERAAEIAARLGIGMMQVHGNALPVCPRLPVRTVPAFAVRDKSSLFLIRTFVERCDKEGQRPAAVLVDAHVPGAYGGTGRQAPWSLLAGFDPGIPVILAGGLTPDNVAEAIRSVRPYAVDVASGVEIAPGKKDVEKMRRFIDNARSA